MKSPEEQIDKALREALKRKFDDFESSPAQSLSKKIFRAITDDPGVIQKSLILSLLLLIFVTGTLMLTSVSGENNANVAVKKSLKPVYKSTENVARGVKSSSVFNAEHETLKTNVAKNAFTKSDAETVLASINETEKNSIEKVKTRVLAGNKINVKAKKTVSQQVVNQSHDLNVKNNVVSNSSITEFEEIVATAERNEALPALNVLENKPFNPYQFNFPQDSIAPFSTFEIKDNTYQKYRWGFIFGVAPLRTFQVLTIAPATNVTYQNFSFPTKISSQTLGFKFTAGVEKNGFQFLVNYGRFSQSFRYEIATDEFVLNPDKSGENKVIRKGTPVEENSLSNLVGVSVKKHYVRRGLFLKNYFGDFGLELNRDLTSKKNMVWINAGIGKELVVDANTRIVVGPYIEYSFMKLRNDQNQFTVQPYQIGLSVGLKFLKK
jgi:hypothetical protein